MAIFVVKDTQPCWVSWLYTIEAESEEDALRKYTEGEHGMPYAQPEIGDSIDGVSSNCELQVEQVA